MRCNKTAASYGAATDFVASPQSGVCNILALRCETNRNPAQTSSGDLAVHLGK